MSRGVCPCVSVSTASDVTTLRRYSIIQITNHNIKFVQLRSQYWTEALNRIKQDAQLSQRDRAAGCVIVFAKSRRLELGDSILRPL